MKNKIINILKDAFNPIAIYLFGSYADKTMTKESDIDIAFLIDPGEPSPDSLAIFETAEIISQQLERSVDLICLNKATTVFAFEITGTGICIYSSDDYKRDEYEMITMSLYQKLNEERAEIIKDGLEKGFFK